MKRTRRDGPGPTIRKSVGSRVAAADPKTVAAARGVSICMTCHAPVDWHDRGSYWEPMDHATDTPHRCTK